MRTETVSDEKVRFVKMRPRQAGGSWCIMEPASVLDHLMDSAPDEEWELVVVEMDPREVETMPEFGGW